MSNMRMSLAALAALTLGTLAAPEPAAAHCDSLDGPVVKAARQALTTGNVDLVMVWVRPQDAPGIRAAFERTLRVRAAGGEARELADLWFFETLVRVHRTGEGPRTPVCSARATSRRPGSPRPIRRWRPDRSRGWPLGWPTTQGKRCGNGTSG